MNESKQRGDQHEAPVRVVVVGAGQWGPNLIRTLHFREDCTVARVVDVDPERLRQVQKHYPGISVESHIEPSLEDPCIDAFVVATPTSTHHTIVKAALLRDKHVLVEKPLARSLSEAEELCNLAKDRKRVLLVGHVFLYNAAVQWVKEFVQSGSLGDVQYVSMERTNLGPIRTDVNAAWDLGAHDVSIANFWLGEEPTHVSAVGGVWINVGVEDAVFATFRYPDDVLVNLHLSWLNPRKSRLITVVGDRRMLTLDDLSLTEPVRVYDKGVSDEEIAPTFTDGFLSFRSSVRESDITIPKIVMREPLAEECDHFLECIQHNAAPRTGGAFGLGVVRALDAIDRSISNHGAQEPIFTSSTSSAC